MVGIIDEPVAKKRPRNEHTQLRSSSFAARGLSPLTPDDDDRPPERHHMAAKEVRFSVDARDKMLRGVDVFSPCGAALRQRPECRARQVVWRTAYY